MNELRHKLTESKNSALANPKDALAVAKEILEIAKANQMTWEIGEAYFCMAYACRVMSDYSNGLTYASSALAIFEKLEDDDGVLRVRNVIGIFYFYFGDYKIALEQFSLALELLEHVENYLLSSSILNNIGEIYRIANDYEKSIAYYKASLKICEAHQLVINRSVILANIGEVYYIKGDYPEAEHYFLEAFESAHTTNNVITKGEAHTKLGKIKCLQKRFDEAGEHYIAALDLFNRVQNKFYLVETLIAISELDSEIGRNPKLHLMEALNYAIEHRFELKISLIYKRLVEYHEAENAFELALHFHKLYHQKEKEIEASNLSKRLELLALTIELNKENSEWERHKKLREKLSKEIKAARKELQEIKMQNETLMEVSNIDELTQIFNRRGINAMLRSQLSKPHDTYDALFMVDIDRFKNYNDYWGHLQGDKCLQSIANALKDLDLDHYFIGRFGGEEFICYLQVDSLEMAKRIADDIRGIVRGLELGYTNEAHSDPVTVSIGGVVDYMSIDRIEAFIKVADERLYASKSQGRDIGDVVLGINDIPQVYRQ